MQLALLLAVIALLSGANAPAATQCSRSLDQHQIDVWQHEDGLPLDTIYAVTQTPDGFIWVATEHGLARFDGMEFHVFDLARELGRDDYTTSYFESLAVSAEGTLYIGPNAAAVLAFEQGTFRLVGREQHWGRPVHALLPHQGRLFAGTRGGGLVVVDGEQVSIHEAASGLAGQTVNALAPRSAGGIWVATAEDGVQWFDGKRFHQLSGYPELEGLRVEAVLEDRAGRLWVGSRSGLFRIEDGQLSAHTQQRTGIEYVTHLIEDEQGTLWIATGGTGVARLCGDRLELLTEDDGLPIGKIEQLFEDAAGDIWLATGGGGLVRLSAGPALPLTSHQGLPAKPILPILQGADGTMWIGTFGGGLVRLADDEVAIYGEAHGLVSDRVLSLSESPSGILWIGTQRGLHQLIDGQMRVYTTADGLPHDAVAALLHDGKRLWIGTLAGLASLEDGSISTYQLPGGAYSGHLRALMMDADGILWIGSDGGGVYQLRDGVLSPFEPPGGLSAASTFGFHQQADGTVWIATTAGLIRIRDDQGTLITSRHGLPDSQVMSFLQDRRDGLWMSSNSGVFRVPLSDLQAVADGQLDRLRVRLFDASDGMPRTEANGGFMPPAWRDRNGRHWYPTTDGVAVFEADRIKLERPAPAVVITSISIDDAEPHRGGELRAPPNPRWIRFRYTAPVFSNPESLQFQYRLSGFQEDWYAAGAERQALYPRLPPGRFEFQVRVRYPDGDWSPVSQLGLVVERHPLKNPWLLLACGLAILLAAAALIRRRYRNRRQRRLRRQQAQKLESLGLLAGGIAHDFNNVLTAISGYSRLTASQIGPDHPLRDNIEEIDKAAERGAALSRQLLAFGRRQEGEAERLDLVPVIKNLQGFLRRLIPETVAIHTELDPDTGDCLINPVHFEQIVLNLVVNARDAMPDGGTVTLELARMPPGWTPEAGRVPATGRWLRFSVRDTGVGMDPKTRAHLFEPFFTTKERGLGTGLGLSVTYGIVRQSGGIIEVESEPGQGTAFHIYLPASDPTEVRGAEGGR